MELLPLEMVKLELLKDISHYMLMLSAELLNKKFKLNLVIQTIFLKNKLNVRYDIEQPNDISSIIEDEVINYVVNKKNIDAIIISDYDKGFITEKLCKTIINYANNNNIPTFVDPKLKNYMKYNGCFLFKPNQNEAETISGEKHIHKILNFIKDDLISLNFF